ncbi:hypothetical protein [Lysinibacillus sp. TE18511]
MAMVLVILIITACIIFFELPNLKKGDTKTIWTFSLLLTIGVVLNIAISLKAIQFSPLDIIMYIFHPVSDFLKTTLLKK